MMWFSAERKFWSRLELGFSSDPVATSSPSMTVPCDSLFSADAIYGNFSFKNILVTRIQGGLRTGADHLQPLAAQLQFIGPLGSLGHLRYPETFQLVGCNRRWLLRHCRSCLGRLGTH